jgi:hypothetical protein
MGQVKANSRITVGPQLCSCCLDDFGRLNYLWLIVTGKYRVLFCPKCDGAAE